MSSQQPPFMPHGGYEKLRSYRVASLVLEGTVVFCQRFLADDRRTSDQMVQAARSGVRNISEGSGAAATSRRAEMKLTNVARASLADELIPDYEHFLKCRRLEVWHKDSSAALRMRKRLQVTPSSNRPRDDPALGGLEDLPRFMDVADAEVAANAMLCATHQAVYLLNRQLRAQGRAFLDGGGFTENLTAARLRQRRNR
ncbi:MAG: four helix bundle suffix domain-containing protein [Planctomycetota bacterium]|jgi:four helix bundle suffix protein